jgi:uncharacterized protein (DUF1697 family)
MSSALRLALLRGVNVGGHPQRLKVGATTRNWRTVTALAHLLLE